MKIEQSRRRVGVRDARGEVHEQRPPDPGFTEQIAQVEREYAARDCDEMLAQVFELGERLDAGRSLVLVAEYRKAVQAFVRHVVRHGIGLAGQASRDPRGRQQLHTVLQEIDAHLLELLNWTLDKERQPLQLLHVLGEMRGLLINLRL